MTAAMSFAFGAGLLATANPCGFVMLPTFIGMQLGAPDDADHRSPLARCAHGFRVGIILSATFSGVLVLADIVLAAGLRSLVGAVPWMAITVGAALMILGTAMLIGHHLSIRIPARLRAAQTTSNPDARVAMFGAGYAIASLSCTLAVLLAVAGQASATSNPIQFLAVFGAFAAGSTSILLALSLSTTLAKELIARAIRRLAPAMHTIAGALLTEPGWV
jgi:cytochrome c biogenesis protein CcdA